MITHWTRDRSRGERLPLEFVVHKQTRQTAELYGLLRSWPHRTGLQGRHQHHRLRRACVRRPRRRRYDLPGGARRLVQRADGYVATVVAGQVIARDGELTGPLPGRIIRGPQHPK